MTLTVPQKLLKAAATLPETFTANDLVVAAWKMDGTRFGLKGYESFYPDSNAVLASLMGERGLVRRGHFDQLGPKLYRLAAAGRMVAGEDERRSLTAPKWPPDLDAEVCRLLGTAALRKWAGDRPGLITRPDERAFFDGDGAAARELVTLMLADSAEYVTVGVPLAGGRVVKVAELESLVACDEWLRKHFGGQP